MAITFFGVATNPVDNGGQQGPTATVVPPASMLDGDLVYVSVHYRASAGTITVGEAGGQTWNATTQYDTTNIRARAFWCRFNGTWSANPTFTVGSGTNNIDAQMLVFRPTSAAYTWTLESGPNSATYAAPANPFTVTVTGRTTAAASTVSVAAWHSVDDNSWGTLAGSGWSKTGLGAQYRSNLSNDNSSAYAYRIQTSAGATNNVSQNQTALGGDAGSTSLFTFAEGPSNVTLDGVASAATAGSLGIAIAVVGIVGVMAAALVGTADAVLPGGGANATATPSGVVASAQAGTITTPFASVAHPPGAGIGAAVGAIVLPIRAVPVGGSAAAAVGTLIGIGASAGVVPTIGVAAAAAGGSLGSAITVAGIAGVSAACVAGTLVAQVGGITHAAGHPSPVFATAQVGAIAVLAGPTAAGVSAATTAELLEVTLVVSEIDGVQAVAAAGSLVQQATMPIQGVAAIAAAGTIGVASNAILTVVGVAGTATIGNLVAVAHSFVSVAATPNGVSAAAAAGAPAPQWTQIITPVGAAANSQVGTLLAIVPPVGTNATVPLSGVAAVAEAGAPSPRLSQVITPLGVAAAAQAGTVSVVVPSPIVSITTAPSGVAAAAQAGDGSAAWTFIVPLIGVEASASAGVTAAEGGDSISEEVFPVGVAALAQLGTITTGEALASVAGAATLAQAGTVTAVGLGPVQGYLTATIQVRPALTASVRVRPALTADEVNVRPP